MGLRGWLKRTSAPKPRRPWVRPEFLGIALVAGALLGLAFVGYQPTATGSVEPQQRSEYVGLDPASLPLVDCTPSCQADELLLAWQSAHPNANILDLERVHHDGRLIGYNVVYEE